MIKKILKKICGLETLERRINELEKERSLREVNDVTIQANKQLALNEIRETILYQEVQDTLSKHLSEMNLPVSERNLQLAQETVEARIKAHEVVSTYGLKRFSPTQEQVYNSRVITIQDLKEHPEKYFHKLSKGYLNGVLGLNFSNMTNILDQTTRECRINIYPENTEINLYFKTLFNNERSSKLLIDSSSLSLINRDRSSDSTVTITPIDFLHNYKGFVKFILDQEDITPENKKLAISGLESVRLIYMSALDISSKSRIGDLSELLETSNDTELVQITNNDTEMVSRLKQYLTTNLRGTTYQSIEYLLPLNSKEEFRNLAHEITKHILSSDKEKKGLTTNINKPLEEYSVGEAIVLASYFARKVIDGYKTLDNQVKDALSGKSFDQVEGKCTDYTALAIYYLNEYLIPLQPEKYKNWVFGYDNDHIGDYKHCYLKAHHINPDSSLTIYFADPTKLANFGFKDLKNSEDVVEKVNAMNLPLLINRDAEDLLIAAKDKINKRCTKA